MTDVTAAGGATPAPDATPAPGTTPDPATEAPATAAPTEGSQPEVVKTDEEKAAEASRILNDAKAKKREESQQRWNDRERARAAAETRAERAEARVRELEAKQAPDPSRYDDMSKLNADQITHTLDRREADTLKGEAKTARDEANREVAELWNERAAAFKTDAPDFDEVAYKAPIDEQSAAAIARMPEGPAIAYYLGKNPAEARELRSLSERDRAIELGRLAGRLSQQPVRRTTQAPAPIVNGVTGKSAGGSAKIADLPFDDYAKLVANEMGGKR